MTFAASTTNAWVQLNAGADTITAAASLTQSTVWGGADGDSIALKASSQSEIDGQAGNDTLNFAVGTYSQSTIRGGAGVTRFTGLRCSNPLRQRGLNLGW